MKLLKVIFLCSLLLLGTVGCEELLEDSTSTPSSSSNTEESSSGGNPVLNAGTDTAENDAEIIEIEGEEARVLFVIDGDTIEVERADGTEARIRYLGINTPERDEPCYDESRNANRDLVEGKTVILVKDISDTDRFGRPLRYIYVDGVFVNESLIRDGWGEVVLYPPDELHYADFSRLEDEAFRAGLGCHPSGIFDDNNKTR